jgi:hypothetical protein
MAASCVLRKHLSNNAFEFLIESLPCDQEVDLSAMIFVVGEALIDLGARELQKAFGG